MNILITGSSGLVGRHLIPTLEADGHYIKRLVRSQQLTDEGAVYWSPLDGELNLDNLGTIDAVIHLAGEPIMGRWTDDKKLRIRRSRVDVTEFLCSKLSEMSPPPKVMVAASAIGFYGDRGDQPLHENASPGTGFLPEVCHAWEQATAGAGQIGIRVVNLRIGVVLTTEGGALTQMLTPFRLGLGGKIGDGRQYMSWLTLDDLIGMIRFALDTETLSGPVNAVAPEPVSNLEMTRTLGEVLHRPTIFSVPAFGVRLLFGEMGEDLLLAGARVIPEKLTDAGYEFKHPALAPALKSLLA